MLTKPLSLILIFALSIANFIILLIPVSILAFPLFLFFKSLFLKIGFNALFFLISRVSFLMLLYISLDFIFGFTVRRINKASVPFEEMTSIIGHDEINEAFKWLKQKFDLPKAKLLINPGFEEINAYAVGSMRIKTVTLTMGLIQHIYNESRNETEYMDAIKGVLGHEMSHLANSDYLPGLIASANEVANNHVSNLIRIIFVILAYIFKLVPFFGRYITKFLFIAYSMLSYMIYFFYDWIITPFYKLIQKSLSRSIEYRCDTESAYAWGGKRMQTALSRIGSGSYFSVFSTHPRTKNRIKHIDGISPIAGKIKPSILDKLANLLSILLIIFVCAYTTAKTNVPDMYQHYMKEVHYPMKNQYSYYENKALTLYYTYIK